jgi:HD-like signal output (HDOD) protein
MRSSAENVLQPPETGVDDDAMGVIRRDAYPTVTKPFHAETTTMIPYLSTLQPGNSLQASLKGASRFVPEETHAIVAFADDLPSLVRLRLERPTVLRVFVGPCRYRSCVLASNYQVSETTPVADVATLCDAYVHGKLPPPPKDTRLPSIPHSLRRLMKVLNDPKADGKRLCEVLAQDPAMVAVTIKTANFALFQQTRAVASLERALLLLGVDAIRVAAMSGAFFQAMGLNESDIAEARDAGFMASHVIRRLNPTNREAAMTAGFLMDLGQLLLLKNHSDYPALRRTAALKGLPICSLERENYGTTHTEQGATLLQAWGLPFDIVRAIALSHTDRPNPLHGPDTRAVVYAASMVVEAHRHGNSADIDASWLAQMGWSNTIREVRHELMDMAMPPPDPPSA